MRAIAFVLCLPTIANAGDFRTSRWRAETSLGVGLGTMRVDGKPSVFGLSGHFDLGVRHEDWVFFGEYGVYDASAPEPTTSAEAALATEPRREGLMHRLGGNVRYAIYQASDYDGGADFWIEAGLGVQHYRWDAGGTWTRRDLSFGAGVTLLGGEGRGHGGATLGVHVLLARRGDVSGDEPATCTGPCDTATGPTTIDRAISGEFTFHFGN